MVTADTSAPHPSTAARVVAALTLILGVGTTLLTIGHAGITLPLVSGLGPGGNRVILPAAIAFAVATALAFTVAFGALGRRSWAWALGLLLHALVVLGSAMPYRGVASAVGIAIGLVSLAVLLSPPGRKAFLPNAA